MRMKQPLLSSSHTLNHLKQFQQLSVRLLSDTTRASIDKIIKEKDIVVFMKGTKIAPQCGFSRAVVQILQAQGVPDFKDVNVLADEEIRTGIKEFSSWPTIPQVFVKGEFVGGCDIMMNMFQSGELEKLLVDKKILDEIKPTDAEK